MEAHVSKLGNKLGSKLGPSARSILEAGREGDDPTPADRARVKRALMRSIAASTALGAATAASAASAASAAAGGAAAVDVAAKATSFGLGIKLFGVAVLACAVGAGVLLQRASSPDPAAIATRAAPSNTASATRDAANAAPATVDTASAATARAAIADPAAPARPSEPAAIEKAPAPSARALPRIAAREPVDRPEEEITAPVPAPPPAPAASPAPEEDPLAAETRRLREAHSALQAGDPQKALGLLGEQGGQLGEERAAARVLALCQMGRVAEAESARAAFLREHPRSPLADRVRSGCARSIAK
jgi:hypothetical protein